MHNLALTGEIIHPLCRQGSFTEVRHKLIVVKLAVFAIATKFNTFTGCDYPEKKLAGRGLVADAGNGLVYAHPVS